MTFSAMSGCRKSQKIKFKCTILCQQLYGLTVYEYIEGVVVKMCVYMCVCAFQKVPITIASERLPGQRYLVGCPSGVRKCGYNRAEMC